MKRTLIVAVMAVMAATVRAAIIASEADFTVDCGTAPGQIASVTYKSSTATNKIAQVSSPQDKGCSVTAPDAQGNWVLSDVSTKCTVTQSNANKNQYLMQVVLQEDADVYLPSYPAFFVGCEYTAGDVKVTTKIDDGGSFLNAAPGIVSVTAVGDPDMTYSLEIVDNNQQLLTAAKFGQDINLRVSMSGTDADENGVKVKECVATSGDVELPIIEDYCVVDSKKDLFQTTGFTSLSTQAIFPMTVFALAGSTVSSVEFSCNVTVCPEACDGANCVVARRKRRASEDEPTEDKSVLMTTKLQILPVSVPTAPAAQTSETAVSCMQSLGFIVTVAVLAVLLLVAMVAVIFMFTARRRELQKQGA